MLNHVETMFDQMAAMMKKLKKANYEKNMKEFRSRNEHYFLEMTEHMDSSADKNVAAEEIAAAFVGTVSEAFQTKGKIRSRVQTDLNFFMIYYVFPAILLTDHDNAALIADAVCARWRETFPGNNISYADYDHLYQSFNEKIFGLF